MDGVRVPMDGVRVPMDGVRVPVDGVRVPMDGVRVHVDGVRVSVGGVRVPVDCAWEHASLDTRGPEGAGTRGMEIGEGTIETGRRATCGRSMFLQSLLEQQVWWREARGLRKHIRR